MNASGSLQDYVDVSGSHLGEGALGVELDKSQRSSFQQPALDHNSSGHGHSGILSLGKFGKYQRPSRS